MATLYDMEKKDKELLQSGIEQPSYIKKWIEKNTLHYSRYSDVKKLLKMKDEKKVTISLCFPTLNEEDTIGKEITVMRRYLMRKYPLLDEIAVVDSGSTDSTEMSAKEAGADFYYSSEILPKYRSYRGKGENLWKSLYVLKGDIICWIDADITNIHPRFALGLIGPLLEFDHLKYVKAFYKRPIRIKGELHYTGGGRVTELVVRPFFNLLFPELTGIAQPLSGEYAGRRELLERLPFFTGYGVETGHLIDILRIYGLDIIGQCDLDVRIHRNQNIEALRSMAYRILKILLQRADDMGRIEIFQDISDSLQVLTGVKNEYSIEKMKVWGIERPPMITIPEYRKKEGIQIDEKKETGWDFLKPLPYTASLMFHKDLVIPRLNGENKQEIINELIYAARDSITDIESAKKKLMESGEIVITPIGKNIAIFNAFGDFVDDIIPMMGLKPEGVIVESNYKKPVHIVFAFLAPEYLGEIYNKMLSSLSKSFSRMEHFEWLLKCKTPSEIISFIGYLESKNKIMKMLNIKNIENVYL